MAFRPVGILLCLVLTEFAQAAGAASAPPAMIVPGQFNVSPSGAATYTVPIAVPPGTAGMVPELSLDYSSQAGDGIVGVGWTLGGLPSIARCSRTLAQDGVHGSVNYDTNDRFCMGGQRLIYVTGGSGYGTDSSQYRTENEGFSKIIEHNAINSSNVWFEVWTKSGQHMEFGHTADSFVLTVGLTSNVARSWGVNKISDTVGNYLTVTYNCATAGGGCTDRTVNGEAYPLEIDYTGHSTTPVTAPYNSVKFSYCSRDVTPVCTRGDSVPSYQAGASNTATIILWDIKTYQDTNLVYDYKLDYRTGTTTTRSRLTSITLCGVTTCMAPTTFTWQGGTGYLTPNSPIVESWYGGTIYAGDFDGNGLTDIQITTPGFYGDCDTTFPYHLGTSTPGDFSGGSGTIANPGFGSLQCTVMSPSVAGIAANGASQIAIAMASTFCIHPSCTPPGTTVTNSVIVFSSQLPSILWRAHSVLGTPTHVFPGDLNGDGLVDFFQQDSPTSYGYIANSSGSFTQDGGHSGLSPSSAGLGVGDFDGDGCTDLLAISSTNSVKYLYCNPAASSATAPSVSGFNITLGDFNGDGKTDILLTAPATAGQLWLSTGLGFVEVSSSLPSDWGKYDISIGDWNGDGKADLLLVAPGGSGKYGSGTSHKLFISTGTGFTAAVDSGITPITISNSDTTVTATVAGWNNDGGSGVWIHGLTGSTHNEHIYNYAYTPELITTISNGIGSQTQVSYDRLNKNSFYSPASGTTYPFQNINGPIYVVQQVDASNGLGSCTTPGGANCYTSTYAYAGATVNVTGRGFLGFSSVTITDVQTGIVQTTNYHTDCDIPSALSAPYLECPLLGLIGSQTKTCPVSACTGGAVTLSSITNTYNATNLGGTSNFVALTQSVVASNDLNGASMPGTTTTFTYDAYGNALTTAVTVTDGSSKTTTNSYNNDATNWFLGRLFKTSVNSIVGSSNLTRYSWFCYDAATGLLTREVVEPNTLTCTTGSAGANTLITDYTYDAFGNKSSATISGTGIASRTSYAGYDSIGQFQILATNALGQSESWTHDLRFAGPTAHTGPSSLTTSWSYDDIGRQTSEIRPDGTRTASSFAYCSGSCVTYGAFTATVQVFASDGTTHIGPTQTISYDMLSRAINTDVQGFDGSTIRTTTVYDANGRIGQSSRPYFATAPPCPGAIPCWTSFTYDRLGRATLTSFPDSSTTSSTFNGLTTSVTNGLSQTTTTVKNAQGLTYTVTDAVSQTTTYIYDAFGNATTVTDPASNVVTNVYDIRGNRTDSYDPDMGHWTYVHDVLGELTSQTDAQTPTPNTTMISYDLLGRPITRTEAGLYSTWTFGTDVMSRNVGQLIEAKACTTSGCATLVSDRTLTYDNLGRPAVTVLHTPTDYFGYATTYNSTNGQIDTVQYPSGLIKKSLYNGYGYLCRLTDNGGSHTCTTSADSHVIWTANSRDAELHLTQSTAGNNVVTTQSFDPKTGLPICTFTGASCSTAGTVASLSYGFDAIGNLTSRGDLNGGVSGYTEHFCYDPLNRLTNYALGATCSGGTTVAYDTIGNITEKSDLSGCSSAGCYAYPTSGSSSVRPHAVSSISGNVNAVSNPFYSYDGNGNLNCTSSGASCTGTMVQTVSMTSFNMASLIAQGSTSVGITYDSEHSRIRQISIVSGSPTNTTDYLNDPASGAMSQRVQLGSATPTFTDFITVDGKIVAQRTASPTAPQWGYFMWGSASWTSSAVAVSWQYFILDHLGSVAVVTDGGGLVLQRLSYDAWGKMRSPDGTMPACGISSPTTRGFTNQEQIAAVCLVNLNARLYDPTIGKFLAPDPVVGAPEVPNAFNRYAYVLNNPLSFTDPTGNDLFGDIFSFILDIAVFFIAPEIAPELFATVSLESIGVMALSGAIIGGINAGISGGNILQGALFGGLGAGLAVGPGAWLGNQLGGALAGGLLGPTTAAYVGKAVAQGVVGGIVSAAEGQNFGSGFLAAGIGSLGSAFSGGHFNAVNLIASAALGGAASVLGGGKFANGAVTGAFAYAASAYYGEDDGPTSAGGSPGRTIGQYVKGTAGPFGFKIWSECESAFCGAEIQLHYNGDASNLDWLQTASANSFERGEDGTWRLDNDGADTPFYPTKYASGPNFKDYPGWTADRSFQAETSVVTQNSNGTYSIIGTVKWGYTYTAGSGVNGVALSTPTVTSASSLQQRTIKSLNGGH